MQSDIWSDSKFSGMIETFGYQMAEMGRQQAFESEARNSGDYDGARMYAQRAEMYREAAYEAKKHINAQIAMRRTDIPVTV